MRSKDLPIQKPSIFSMHPSSLRKTSRRIQLLCAGVAVAVTLVPSIANDSVPPEKLEAMRQEYLKRSIHPSMKSDERAQLEVKSHVLFGALTNRVVDPNRVAKLKKESDKIRDQVRRGITPTTVDHETLQENRRRKALQDLVETYDLNGDGKVTFQEEASVRKTNRRKRSEKRLSNYLRERSQWFLKRFGQSVFDRFDADKDGRFSSPELASASRACIDAEKLLAPKCDINGDGLLQASEQEKLLEEVERLMQESLSLRIE